MSHKGLIALLLSCNGKFLVGKHTFGKYRNKVGVPSTSSSIDKRPQLAAGRLAEAALLGIQGGHKKIQCKLKGVTALGLHVYELEIESQVCDTINNLGRYIESCFFLKTDRSPDMPTGLLIWKTLKFVEYEDSSTYDEITRDALTL